MMVLLSGNKGGKKEERKTLLRYLGKVIQRGEAGRWVLRQGQKLKCELTPNCTAGISHIVHLIQVQNVIYFKVVFVFQYIFEIAITIIFGSEKTKI